MEETRNGIVPPINIPTKTLGSDKQFYFCNLVKAAIIASAANAAAPIANPLPMAAVVFLIHQENL